LQILERSDFLHYSVRVACYPRLAASNEEIQVGAFVCLLDMLDVKPQAETWTGRPSKDMLRVVPDDSTAIAFGLGVSMRGPGANCILKILRLPASTA